MKRITITTLLKDGVKTFDKIPKEGMYITFKRKPVALVQKVDKSKVKKEAEKVQEEIGKKAEDLIQKIKVGTFYEMDRPEPQRMGICSRCGRQGEVKKWKWIDKQSGTSKTGWLCTGFCYPKFKPGSRPMTGPPEIKKSVPVEVSQFSRGEPKDFGPSNTHGSF